MSFLSTDSKTIGRVPILNGDKRVAVPVNPRTFFSLSRDAYNKGIAHASSQTVVKPGRQLGGCYISDKSENQGSVKLCDSCVTSYWFGRGGLKQQGTHRPSWNNYFTSDCDGCGESYCLVILFLPQDQFSKVLGGTHGKFASPRAPIFSRFFKRSTL